jgi:heme/copper-type cytochrome/quinol oxidase subunit 3
MNLNKFSKNSALAALGFFTAKYMPEKTPLKFPLINAVLLTAIGSFIEMALENNGRERTRHLERYCGIAATFALGEALKYSGVEENIAYMTTGITLTIAAQMAKYLLLAPEVEHDIQLRNS